MKKNYLLMAIAAVVSVAFVFLVAQNNRTKTQKETAEMALLEAKVAAAEAKAEKAVVYKKTAARRPVSYQSPKMVSETQNTAKAKKGWSKAAKGAVIGGAGGAIAGAVINKRNRAAGAVIGGVIGAGGGYAIGRSMDKKDGRIQFN